MKSLVESLSALNSSVSFGQKGYKSAIDARLNAFKNKEDSVQKLLIQIRAAIESQYGKKSTEATLIGRIIKRMRTINVRKTNADPSTEEGDKTVRRYERSYASMTYFFNDIVSTMEKFESYDSSKERVKVQSLKETTLKIGIFNSEVAKKIQELKAAIDHRKLQFDEPGSRIQRIKAYVKGQYGTNSKEFALIRSM